MRNILKNYWYLFGGILLVSIFLNLSALGKTDLYSDNSIYAFRSMGWTDYIGWAQLSPIQWLGHTTWWSKLSFQDAPPIVFAIENISIKLFGNTAASVQLPFLLADVLTVCAVFFGIRKLKDVEAGLWASFALAVSSFALWGGISSNLEGIESFFITSGFISMALYFKEGTKKYLYFWSFFLGMALMSKYTAIFVIPASVILFCFRKKTYYEFVSDLKSNYKRYVIALVLFLLTLSPAIIYNYELFHFRGTFDTSLSAILGMKNDLDRGANFNFVQNCFETISTFFHTSSFPYIFACMCAVVWLAIKSQRKKYDMTDTSLVTYIILMLFMFGFMGSNARWLTISMPLLSIAFGFAVVDLKRRYSGLYIPIIAISILVFEFAYSVNTNLLFNPIGKKTLLYSTTRNESLGFNELDEYLSKKMSPLPKVYNPKTVAEVDQINHLSYYGSHVVVIYDTRINWFATWWYFERYRVNYRLPVFSSDNDVIMQTLFPKDSAGRYILSSIRSKVYFVEAIDQSVMYPLRIRAPYYASLDPLATYLDAHNFPYEVITSKGGRPAFKVYTMDL